MLSIVPISFLHHLSKKRLNMRFVHAITNTRPIASIGSTNTKALVYSFTAAYFFAVNSSSFDYSNCNTYCSCLCCRWNCIVRLLQQRQ
jgi:hypothetical protein